MLVLVVLWCQYAPVKLDGNVFDFIVHLVYNNNTPEVWMGGGSNDSIKCVISQYIHTYMNIWISIHPFIHSYIMLLHDAHEVDTKKSSKK